MWPFHRPMRFPRFRLRPAQGRPIVRKIEGGKGAPEGAGFRVRGQAGKGRRRKMLDEWRSSRRRDSGKETDRGGAALVVAGRGAVGVGHGGEGSG